MRIVETTRCLLLVDREVKNNEYIPSRKGLEFDKDSTNVRPGEYVWKIDKQDNENITFQLSIDGEI